MSRNNSLSSYIISSIVKTFIFIFIVGISLYFFKSYQPKYYNKVYSALTGNTVQTYVSNDSSNVNQNDNDEQSKVIQSSSMSNDVITEQTSIEEDDSENNFVEQKQSSNNFITTIEENVSKVVKDVVEEIENTVVVESKKASPKFIDGYEVITVEDTEPKELLDGSSVLSSKNNNKQNIQQNVVQEEVVYVEPENYEDYEGPNWAVVAVNTEYYNKDKKKGGNILGGIVVETHDHIFHKNMALIKCFQIKDGIVKKEIELYIKESELVKFNGPYSNDMHPDKTTIIEFCKIRSQYQKLLDELRREELKKNPYFNEYKEANAKYTNMKKESDELEAKRKTVSGAEKANLEDKIHRLKIEEVTARKTLNDSKRKYDSWRNKNLGTGDDIKINPTPELNKLKQKMDALYPRANQICPGI